MQVGDFTDGGDGIAVLSQSHGPAGDEPPVAGGALARDGFNSGPWQSAARFQLTPLLPADVGGVVIKAGGVRLNKLVIDEILLDEGFGEAEEEGVVAIGADGEEFFGERGRAAEHAAEVLRVHKAG